MNPRPRLVVLDGHTLNPGDLSWAALEALGDCTIHAHTPPADVVARAAGAAASRRGPRSSAWGGAAGSGASACQCGKSVA